MFWALRPMDAKEVTLGWPQPEAGLASLVNSGISPDFCMLARVLVGHLVTL